MKILRTILMIFNVLAAIGLVLTTLAGTTAPSRGMLLNLLAFAYLPMLALNLLLVLIWLAAGRWQFLISVVAIAARWSFVGLYFQVGGTSKVPDRDAHPQMVTVMTYNVHLFRGGGETATPSDSNAAEFLKLVRHAGTPDVLCLQEYGQPKTLALTDSLTLMGYNHYYGVNTSKTGLPYGTVVFSRMPITYVNRIDSEKLLVDIMHPGGERFRVCCLHMESYRFDDTDRREIERMRHGDVDSTSHRTLAKVKQTIASHQTEWEEHLKAVVTESTLPLVVAGDLNDIPSSWLYSQLTSTLHDTYCEQGFGFATTYNGGFPKYRIDMVLHGDGFRTLSYKRIKSDLSDHYPVLTALELEK